MMRSFIGSSSKTEPVKKKSSVVAPTKKQSLIEWKVDYLKPNKAREYDHNVLS